jgi:hypothetical protein
MYLAGIGPLASFPSFVFVSVDRNGGKVDSIKATTWLGITRGNS